MVVEPDRYLHNADWTKKTWDILPPTLPRLLQALGVEKSSKAQQKAAVAHFMTLPAAVVMPDSLRDAVKRAGLID